MLSHELKTVFIHVPKTGGQSVERVFVGLSGLTWSSRGALLLRENPDPDHGPVRLDHLSMREYQSLGYVTSEQADAYFTFGFVRNPFARIVSEYKYREYPRQFDFRTYVMERLPEPPGTRGYYHTLPMHHFLADGDGRQLVDFVGYFEEFQEDFNEACRRLGLEPITLPHENKSAAMRQTQRSGGVNPFRTFKQVRKRRRRQAVLDSMEANLKGHYTEYYDDVTREKVTELYGKDLELFGYTFEGRV